jgi:hypothetical protein
MTGDKVRRGLRVQPRFSENPMTRYESAAKFGENASGVLDSARRVGS